MSRASAVIALMDEVRQMECTVLYFQNKILRKRIAIAELMSGIEVEADSLPEKQDRPIPELSPRGNGEIVLSHNYKDFLASRSDGAGFCYKDITDFVQGQRPEIHRSIIRQRTHPVVRTWLAKGIVCKDGNYFFKVQQQQGTT